MPRNGDLAAPETEATSRPAKPKIGIQASMLPVVRYNIHAPAKRMTSGELLALEQESLDQDDLHHLGHAF